MAEDEGVGDVSEGGGSLKRVIILLIILLLIGLAVWYLMSDDEVEEKPQEIEEAGPPEAPFFTEEWPFIVNLEGGNRFLNITVQLMITSPEANAYLTPRTFEIKDMILRELQHLKREDIKTLEDRDRLRKRIIKRISRLYPDDPPWDEQPIYKVLFVNYLIQ